jgi:hypothetical protein
MNNLIWGHKAKHSANFRSSICLTRKNFKTIDQPRQPPESKLFSACQRKAEVSKNNDRMMSLKLQQYQECIWQLYIYSRMYRSVYLPSNPSLKSAI